MQNIKLTAYMYSLATIRHWMGTLQLANKLQHHVMILHKTLIAITTMETDILRITKETENTPVVCSLLIINKKYNGEKQPTPNHPKKAQERFTRM